MTNLALRIIFAGYWRIITSLASPPAFRRSRPIPRYQRAIGLYRLKPPSSERKRTCMAEPSWVLQARRVRMRRYADRDKGPDWLRPGPSSFWRRHVWPLWLIDLLINPFPHLIDDARPQRARQAAHAARAALEDVPGPAPELAALDLRSPAGRLWSGVVRPAASTIRRLPLRYAAHLVTVLIVATIALVSGDSSWAGALQIDSPQVRVSSLAEEPRDPLVRWEPSSAQGHDDTRLALPAIRVPQSRFEPAFIQNHQLAEGETLGELASRYRVSVASLFWANDLQRGDVLAAGQELRIPRISGIPHVIQPDETVESIAEQFHVAPSAIVLFKANGISEDRPLPADREIFIPGGTLPYPNEILTQYGDEQGIAAMRAVSAGVVQEEDTNLRVGPGRDYPRVGYLDAGRRMKLIARHGDWVKVEAGIAEAGWVRADLLGLSDAVFAALAETNDFPPLPPRWVWPTSGTITSPFGWRFQPFRSFHDGLDIANAAGTRIRAARAGQVIEAGWCSGFGYCVKLDHGEGIMTIYGHLLKKPPVVVGDVVEVGDTIGSMGSTFDRSGGGFSTGVHLHFTVKVNGKAVNPLKFLP